MSKYIDIAKRLRPIIEQASTSLDDKTASSAEELFPTLKNDGSLVKYKTRINWRGTLKQAAVDLWDTEENDPDHAPSLWTDIGYRDGIRIIPEVMTAGDAFSKDEKGWWGVNIYVSLIDNNVWTPDAYPAGWQKE